MTITNSRNAAALSFFRAFFGLVMLGSYIRFWLKGWIEEIYIQPTYHFKYYLFEWVNTPSTTIIYTTFAVAGFLALLFTIGFLPRIISLIFFFFFLYIELWERSLYLNHYYFISVLLLLLVWIPTAGYFSVTPSQKQKFVDPKCYLAIQVMVSCVYFHAGIAKINSDWLLHGEPLLTWLTPHYRLFTLDGLISLRATAIAMSWGGMLFDTTVWLFLFCKKTRIYAFLVAVVFHVTVGLLFPIGVFPFVMVGAITIFFDPDWPLQLLAKLRRQPYVSPQPTEIHNPPATFTFRTWGLTIAAALLAVQLVYPLRCHFYPGFQNWNDDGYAFSWRVMLVEREGVIDYVIHYKDGSQEIINPREKLTPQQYHMLSISPDMIVKFAKHLATLPEYHPDKIASITASSILAFNGRLPQSYVNPEVNLLDITPSDFHTTFILPHPE